jgi:hypothetical protein
VHTHYIIIGLFQVKLSVVSEGTHGLQRRGAVVLEGVSMDVSMEDLRVIPSSRLAAEVVDDVFVEVTCVQEAKHF